MSWRELLATARAEPVDRESLEHLVAAVHPGATVRTVTPIGGGLSSLLDRVELVGGPVEAVVLRRLLPEFGAGAADVARETAAYRAAATGGVRVPDLLWHDDGGALGRPALLLGHVPGRPIIGELEDARAVTALVEAVSAVHAVHPGDGSGLPALSSVADHLDAVHELASASDVVDAGALHAAVADLADAFEPSEVLLHGDLHGGNVLWDGRAVTGLLDWSEAGRGVRWHDEAYLVMDTELAHGVDAGRRLRDALAARRDVPVPADREWALWSGIALLRALPTPAEWREGYEAGGCTGLTEELLTSRYVGLVDAFLDAHGSRAVGRAAARRPPGYGSP